MLDGDTRMLDSDTKMLDGETASSTFSFFPPHPLPFVRCEPPHLNGRTNAEVSSVLELQGKAQDVRTASAPQ